MVVEFSIQAHGHETLEHRSSVDPNSDQTHKQFIHFNAFDSLGPIFILSDLGTQTN